MRAKSEAKRIRSPPTAYNHIYFIYLFNLPTDNRRRQSSHLFYLEYIYIILFIQSSPPIAAAANLFATTPLPLVLTFPILISVMNQAKMSVTHKPAGGIRPCGIQL